MTSIDSYHTKDRMVIVEGEQKAVQAEFILKSACGEG
jgi:hypothetical protein